MMELGHTSLADIARALDTTPQAVSNWKSRGHVPHHIELKIKKNENQPIVVQTTNENRMDSKEEFIGLSDILLMIAEQIKIIILTPAIFLFLSFTYNQFMVSPMYKSTATFLLQGGTAGTGSFLSNVLGANSVSANKDLSNIELLPEILRSRTFSKKILEREFYSREHNKKLTLLAILTHGSEEPPFGKDTLINEALSPLEELISFDNDPKSAFSTLSVISGDPYFSKEVAEVALDELEKVNSFFKSQSIREKTRFINNRIISVQKDLEFSEQILKEFREKNRQISSPALMLEQERLSRDVEIQKGIFLTLKQQLELAKIEEVGKASIFQVLDRPLVPTYGHGKSIIQKLVYSLVFGTLFGLFLAFLRSLFNSSDVDERKKIRKIKSYIKKKTKDFVLDPRISGGLAMLLILCSPFYFGHESSKPVIFGRYSALLFTINLIYVTTIFLLAILFFYSRRKKQ